MNIKKLKGASTLQKVGLTFLLVIVFVFALAFAVSGMGFIDNGEAAPQFSDGNSYLTDECGIPSEYKEVFTEAANQFDNVSPALLAAIFYAGEHYDSNKKSGYWPDINGTWETSKSDAQGPFQFTESTWRDYGEGDFSNAQDIRKAARAAANLISQNYKTQHGTDSQKIQKVITRYNPNYKNTDPGYVDRVYKQLIAFSKCVKSYDSGQIAESADNFFLQDRQKEKTWRSEIMDGEGQSGRPLIDGTMIPTAIVLHWTAGPNKQSALDEMASSKNAVHLIVDEKGKVYQLLPLNAKIRSGSHVASQFSIAIEIVSTTALGDDDPNRYKVHEDILLSKERAAQRKAVVDTINHLHEAYHIQKIRGKSIKGKELEKLDIMETMGIFGHYQTGPKKDPGERYMEEIWNQVGAK